jgi:hypothetical protein
MAAVTGSELSPAVQLPGVTSTAFKRTVTATGTLDAFPSVATSRNFARFPPGSTASGTHAQSLFADAAPANNASNTATKSTLPRATDAVLLEMERNWKREVRRVGRNVYLETTPNGCEGSTGATRPERDGASGWLIRRKDIREAPARQIPHCAGSPVVVARSDRRTIRAHFSVFDIRRREQIASTRAWLTYRPIGAGGIGSPPALINSDLLH